MTLPRTPAFKAIGSRVAWRLVLTAAVTMVAAAVGLQGLAGCQMASRFRGPGYSRSNGVTLAGTGETVTVGITHALLDGRKRGVFDDYTRKTIASLPSNDGFIGSTVRTRVFGNEVWTMTVWRDEAALDGFVRSPTHRAAMREGIGAVTKAQFLRFQLPKEAVPPTWDDVMTRLKSVPFVDYAAERTPAYPETK
jgi:heme-degrading monooxygenase HmoA